MAAQANGRRVLVAGASAGIGAALVAALAGDGHAVLACARREDALRRATDDGRLAAWRTADVGDEAQVRALMGWAGERAGGLDALIVCAGAFGAIGPFHETESARWWVTLRDNVLGLYLLAKHALPLLDKGVRPRIVTFSGGGAFAAFPRYSAYATSKAAVVRLTECLAEELKERGIAVNAVAPGMIATEIHEATLRVGPAAAGEQWERTRTMLAQGGVPVAVPVDCVRFLLSAEADGLTGKVIAANFDPWREPEFKNRLGEIMASELYTMRRINPAHLPAGPLREFLS